MAWGRPLQKVTQDIFHVEQRLAEIAEWQAALNRNTQEIKDLTASIVTTLHSATSNDLLARLVPAIEIVPSLLQEIQANIRSLEALFADLRQNQLSTRNDVSRVVSLITDLSVRLLRDS